MGGGVCSVGSGSVIIEYVGPCHVTDGAALGCVAAYIWWGGAMHLILGGDLMGVIICNIVGVVRS